MAQNPERQIPPFCFVPRPNSVISRPISARRFIGCINVAKVNCFTYRARVRIHILSWLSCRMRAAKSLLAAATFASHSLPQKHIIYARRNLLNLYSAHNAKVGVKSLFWTSCQFLRAFKVKGNIETSDWERGETFFDINNSNILSPEHVNFLNSH